MWVSSFLIPLALTVIIEASVAFFMGYRDKSSIFAIAAVNAMTNPFINFVAVLILYLGLQKFFYWLILPLELLLIPVEWSILSYAMPHKKKELLRLSAGMNIFSFIIGLLV